MGATKLIDSNAEYLGDPQDAVCALALRRLNRLQLPYLVGGTFAMTRYTGIQRGTKDVDLFVHRRNLDALLQALTDMGLETSIPYPHWLAKAKSEALTFDIIFGSGNGFAPVDDEWFQYARDAELYGVAVKLMPPEELIWSKAFIMERERYDGGDIAHLLRAQGPTLDWPRLERRFGDAIPVLLAHLLLFRFIYSDAADYLPPDVYPRVNALAEQALHRLSRSRERVCRGTVLSREQFLADIHELGYADGRIVAGAMTPGEVWHWTQAIDRPEEPPPSPGPGKGGAGNPRR
ncbi:MAG TPA: nucleotidyltransferase [Vicinamibacterales bacterium]